MLKEDGSTRLRHYFLEVVVITDLRSGVEIKPVRWYVAPDQLTFVVCNAHGFQHKQSRGTRKQSATAPLSQISRSTQPF